MEKPRADQAVGRWVVMLLSGWAVMTAPGLAAPGRKDAGRAGQAWAAEGAANACGCYQDASGSCLCGKKTRCGCPGECEPKGCEEKREKELRKEIEAETKKAQEAGRRYSQSSGDRAEARGGGAGAASPEPRPERKAKAARMSPGQKKELLRLLDLYSAEHGDHAGRTIDQLRGELNAAE